MAFRNLRQSGVFQSGVQLEDGMTTRIRPGKGIRRFATPIALIVGLLVVHWLLSDLSALPRLISSTLAAIQ